LEVPQTRLGKALSSLAERLRQPFSEWGLDQRSAGGPFQPKLSCDSTKLFESLLDSVHVWKTEENRDRPGHACLSITEDSPASKINNSIELVSQKDRQAELQQGMDPLLSRGKWRLRSQTEKDLSNTKGCEAGTLTSWPYVVS